MDVGRGSLLAAVVIIVSGIAGLSFFSGVVTSLAVQNPSVSLDMVTTGNSYTPGDDLDADGLPDPGTNHMAIGTIDNCLTSAAPGNSVQHNHTAQLIIQNVEDVVGWQVRLNYDGGKFRPTAAFNTRPFTDTFTGDTVGFANLPIDGANHRGVVDAASVPAPAAGSQTALIGTVYSGAQTFTVSPDTPAKEPPDDTTYSTTGGGILATFTLQVAAGQAGQPSLFINLDDGDPNSPESTVQIFNGNGLTAVSVPTTQLGDGYHGEGANCVPLDCVNAECPPPPPDVRNHTFVNGAPLPASSLHIHFSKAVTPVLIQNAAGCPPPTISGDHAAGRVDLDWGAVPCVDNSETVVIEITSAQPAAAMTCNHWGTLGQTLFGNCGP